MSMKDLDNIREGWNFFWNTFDYDGNRFAHLAASLAAFESYITCARLPA